MLFINKGMLFINKGMLFVNKDMLFINTELFHPSPKREGILGYYCSGLIKVIDSPSGSFRTNLVSFAETIVYRPLSIPSFAICSLFGVSAPTNICLRLLI